jgi:NADH dehydrogenase FAD-containing subunit
MKNMKLSEPEALEYASQLLQAELIESPKASKKKFTLKITKHYRFVHRKTVVILGGGFAGATLAKKLDQDKRLNVILVDQKPFFESTPEVLRTFVETTIADSLKIVGSITVQHQEYLTRSRFLEASVIEVTPEKVVTDVETIFFDYLVIATGTSYPSSTCILRFSRLVFDIHPSRHDIFTIDIKQNYTTKSERRGSVSGGSSRSLALGDVASRIQSSKSIIIAGGGVVGIELVRSSFLA